MWKQDVARVWRFNFCENLSRLKKLKKLKHFSKKGIKSREMNTFWGPTKVLTNFLFFSHFDWFTYLCNFIYIFSSHYSTLVRCYSKVGICRQIFHILWPLPVWLLLLWSHSSMKCCISSLTGHLRGQPKGCGAICWLITHTYGPDWNPFRMTLW